MNVAIAKILRRINYSPLGRRAVMLDGYHFRSPSCDRLVCLVLNRLGLMGRKDRVVFLECLRQRMTVVDVGANQGMYTLLFSGLVGPAGRVIAFEPEPVLFECLTENVRRNNVRNVVLHQLALGAHAGSQLLRRSALNSGDNRLLRKPDAATQEVISVRTERFDVFLRGTPVDFVKIDVQGWEMEVLLGMEETLKVSPPRAIFFEYSPRRHRENGFTGGEMWNYLTDHGFALYSPLRRGLARLNTLGELEGLASYWGYTNLLALRSPYDSHG